MTGRYDLLLKGGTIVNQNGIVPADIAVRDGRIVDIGVLDSAAADQVFPAQGLHILPGVIDSQVHFREPGAEHKEDLATGSQAAVLGGVTAVFEMPNTSPQTVSREALADKLHRATHRMHCDFAFYVGGTRDNIEHLPELERLPGCCGIKVFMGSSTGDLLLEDDAGVAAVLSRITRRAAFHSEDEYRLNDRTSLQEHDNPASHPVWRDSQTALSCTRRLLALARKAQKKIHVLHVSTAEEMDLLAEHRDIASVEVTPQHLTLSAPLAYQRLGTRAQMNPPIRKARHQARLWWGVNAGVVDVLGSDHAPHTLAEKARPYPASPSGMPGVQTLVPVMLDHVHRGHLTLERFVDLTAHGPQRLFGIAGKGRLMTGYDADFTIVDLNAVRRIEDSQMASRSNWTPYDGMTVTGWPVATIIRGRIVMRDDEIIAPGHGEAVRFL